MAVGPGADSQGLWPDKEEQVCSRLRLEGTNSGFSRFTPVKCGAYLTGVHLKGSEAQGSGLVKFKKRKATLNGEL